MARRKRDAEPKTERTDGLAHDKAWVDRARKLRKDWEERFQVERSERFLLGEQWETVEDKALMVVLNHFAASIDTDLPNLFYQAPKWFVRPTARSTPATELKARVAEATLEAVATQDQNLKRAGSLAVLQSFFRLGCIEAIYEPLMVPNPDAKKPIPQRGPDGEPLRYPAMVPGVPSVDPLTGQPVMPEPVPHPMAGEVVPILGPDGQPRLEPKEIHSDDTFRFEWVDAAMLLLDPDGGPDASKWRMIGKEVVMPLEEAKANEQFAPWRSQLIATEWSSKRRSEDGPREPTQEERTGEGFVRLFVLYDIPQRRMRVVADAQQVEEYLLNEPVTDGLEDHPFSVLSYVPILGPDPSPWPKPLVADWIQPQADYNAARWLVQEHAFRALPKEVYDDATFPDETEQVKYTTGGVGILARVNSTAKPPVPVQRTPMNDALVRLVPMLQSDWRIITGQTGARLQSPGDTTATEASFAERSGNLRDAKKQDAINDWLSTAGWKMLKLLRKNMTFSLWCKLRGYTNRDVEQWLIARGFQPGIVQKQPQMYDLILTLLGETKWQEVRQADLDFDAEVVVVPGSARARNLELERQQWVQFLQVIGQAPQLLMSRELIQETAQKFETINERMVDELFALSQKMLAAKTQVAGHAGTGANGGGAAGQDVAPGAPMESPLIRMATLAAQGGG